MRIKNIQHFNEALLAKWKWRLFSNEESLGGKVIVFKYGESFKGGREEINKVGSRWRRDIEKVW